MGSDSFRNNVINELFVYKLYIYRLAIAAYCQPLLSHDHLNLATDL